MRYIRFTVQEDEEHGGCGPVPFMFSNWTNFSPALFNAHDILEHGTQETGAFDEELAAHGGYLFVRNFGTVYPSNNYTTEQSLSSGLARQYQESTSEVREPRKFYGLTKLEIEQIESFAVGYREGMVKDWKDEIDYDEDYNEPCPFEDEVIWTRLVGWLKYGYARAKRRYKNDWGMAWALFENLDKLLTSQRAFLEQYADTGAVLTLALDYDNGYARLLEPRYPANW